MQPMITAAEKHDARLNHIRQMTERSQERIELLAQARLVLTRLQLYVILSVERDFTRLLDIAVHDDDALTQAVEADRKSVV